QRDQIPDVIQLPISRFGADTVETRIRRPVEHLIQCGKCAVTRRALAMHLLKAQDVRVHPKKLRPHDGDACGERWVCILNIIKILKVECSDSNSSHRYPRINELTPSFEAVLPHNTPSERCAGLKISEDLLRTITRPTTVSTGSVPGTAPTPAPSTQRHPTCDRICLQSAPEIPPP